MAAVARRFLKNPLFSQAVNRISISQNVALPDSLGASNGSGRTQPLGFFSISGMTTHHIQQRFFASTLQSLSQRGLETLRWSIVSLEISRDINIVTSELSKIEES